MPHFPWLAAMAAERIEPANGNRSPFEIIDIEGLLRSVFDKAYGWLLLVIGAAAVLFVVYAGITYITAGPDTRQAEQAKTMLLQVVIGIIVIVAAYAVINLAAALGASVRGLGGA